MSIRVASGWLLALVALASPPAARAQTLRFTATERGTIAAAGNALGLSKAAGQNGPGTRDSIGTFTCLCSGADDSPPSPGNAWPTGTTSSWMQNGSAGALDLAPGATVLHAELVWAGSYQYGEQDVSASLDTPVSLAFGAATISVAPAAETASTLASTSPTGFQIRYYVRSADVTAFVRSHGAGEYAASGIPATETTSINSLNAAGWALLVAVRDESQPWRSIRLWVGGEHVDEDTAYDFAASGLCVPAAGEVRGALAIAALEGDANLIGDQLLVAAGPIGPFSALSGSNNPALNFFASQIDDASGAIDMRGTFGAYNHDSLAGVNISGGRQGWDLAQIALSSGAGTLVNGQSELVLRASTTGDSFVPAGAALAVDIASPRLDGSTLEASAAEADVGDEVVLTVALENLGDAAAEDATLALPLVPGLSVVGFTIDGASGDATGAAVDAARLAAGVPVGTIGAGATRTIAITIHVDTAPATSPVSLAASVEHAFSVCGSSPSVTGSLVRSTTLSVRPTDGGVATEDAGTDAAVADAGSGAADAGTDAAVADAGADADDAGSDAAVGLPRDAGHDVPTTPPDTGSSGCSCRAAGSSGAPGAAGSLAALALVATGALARRRRALAGD